MNGTAKNDNLLTQKYFEGDLSGTVWKLPEGTLKFAVGADYRGDSFDYQADPSLNPAFNVMPAGFPPDVISPSYDLISSAGARRMSARSTRAARAAAHGQAVRQGLLGGYRRTSFAIRPLRRHQHLESRSALAGMTRSVPRRLQPRDPRT